MGVLSILIPILFSAIFVWSNTIKPDPQTYMYKSVDECDIHADVYMPENSGRPVPVLVYIHGGALIYGSRTMIRNEHLKRYLEEEYAVVSIDYRLAPETKLPQIIEDLKDAFRWIRDELPKKHLVDSSKIGVVGHSAGGYLTLMSGICVEPRPKVLISYYGYGDIVGDWYTKPDAFYLNMDRVAKDDSGLDWIGEPVSGRGFSGTAMDQFYLYCRQNGLWTKYVGGVDPSEKPEFFTQYCPVQNVTKDYPPTMLLHGDRDTDVPYQQSVIMANELKKHRVEHRFITIENGEHVFDRRHEDEDVNAAFEEVIDFLGSQLK